MKRFKLIKDLPTFKAGDTFVLDGGSLYLEKREPDSGHWAGRVMAYHRKTLKNFPNILKDWFEEVAPSEAWEPKLGGGYWLLDTYNADPAVPSIWYDVDVDKNNFAMGNCFRTEEEAKDAVEWLKAFTTLRRDTKGYKPVVGAVKYYVYYEYDGEALEVAHSRDVDGVLAFATKEDALASIENHDREWLTYLGLEDRNVAKGGDW